MSSGRKRLIHRWMLQQLGLEGASPPLPFHQTLLRFDEAKDKLGDNIVLSERLKAAIMEARAKEQASVDNSSVRTEHRDARMKGMSIEEVMKKPSPRTSSQKSYETRRSRQDKTSSQNTHPQRPMTIRRIVQANDDPEQIAYARKTWVKEDTITWFAKKAEESARLKRLQAQQTYRGELATSEEAWAKLQQEWAAVPDDQAEKKAEKDEQDTKQAPEVTDGVRKLFGI